MTLIDMGKEIDEIFHELSPKERMRAMRNTMGKIGREIRKQAVSDLNSMSYTLKPRHKGELPKQGKRAKVFKKNIVLVGYRRAIGFHVTVASRPAGKGGHTAVDHKNRRDKWIPAARWFNDGTKWQEARPFMVNAARKLDGYEGRITEVFQEKLNDVVKKHNGTK